MGFLGKKNSNTVIEPVVENHDGGSGGDEKGNSSDQSSEIDFGKKQEGVKRVEAIATVWTKRDLILSYAL